MKCSIYTLHFNAELHIVCREQNKVLKYIIVYSFSFAVPECVFLPKPKCGRVDYTSLNSGSVATFSCDDGCVLSSGVNRSVCMQNETWVPSPPICKGRELNNVSMIH